MPTQRITLEVATDRDFTDEEKPEIMAELMRASVAILKDAAGEPRPDSLEGAASVEWQK